MDHYAGIDVSLELSSVCIVGPDGKVVREAMVLSEPGALIAWASGRIAPHLPIPAPEVGARPRRQGAGRAGECRRLIGAKRDAAKPATACRTSYPGTQSQA